MPAKLIDFFPHLLEHTEVDVQGEFGLQFVREQAQGSINITTTLNPPSRPTVISIINFPSSNERTLRANPPVIVPPQDSPFHVPGHFVMSHVRLCAIKQALELKPISITIRYHIANLTDNRCEDENAN